MRSMSIDIVRGELERLFSLDEMVALSTDLLGFDPKEIGGLASKASFARALTDRAAEVDAVEALVDAVLASACIPFYFQTVDVDNEPYWDGGYMGNPSIWPLIYYTELKDILLRASEIFKRKRR